jgi:hypothetical protein
VRAGWHGRLWKTVTRDPWFVTGGGLKFAKYKKLNELREVDLSGMASRPAESVEKGREVPQTEYWKTCRLSPVFRPRFLSGSIQC